MQAGQTTSLAQPRPLRIGVNSTCRQISLVRGICGSCAVGVSVEWETLLGRVEVRRSHEPSILPQGSSINYPFSKRFTIGRQRGNRKAAGWRAPTLSSNRKCASRWCTRTPNYDDLCAGRRALQNRRDTRSALTLAGDGNVGRRRTTGDGDPTIPRLKVPEIQVRD